MTLISGFDEYGCDCVAGFVGRHCKRDVDECLSFQNLRVVTA